MKLCKHCGWREAATGELWCAHCLGILERSPIRDAKPIAFAATPKRRARGGKWRAKPGTTLPPREVEVLERLLRGLSNKQIAEELGIAVKTIENQRISIMDRTQCSSSVQLGYWAAVNGYQPKSESSPGAAAQSGLISRNAPTEVGEGAGFE